MAEGSAPPAREPLSCTRFADALYFCDSPVYQLRQLYRSGELDDCRAKWTDLWDCMALKAKPDAAAEARAALHDAHASRIAHWTPAECACASAGVSSDARTKTLAHVGVRRRA